MVVPDMRIRGVVSCIAFQKYTEDYGVKKPPCEAKFFTLEGTSRIGVATYDYVKDEITFRYQALAGLNLTDEIAQSVQEGDDTLCPYFNIYPSRTLCESGLWE